MQNFVGMKSRTKSIIYVMLCVLLWSLIPLVSKLGQADLDNHQFLFWSSVVSLATFMVINISNKSLSDCLKLSKRNWIHAIVLGFLGTYLYYILLYFGYAHAKGLEVLVIQYSWPIFVIILSVFILKETLNAHKIISIVLGFLGVFMVLTKGDFTNIHLDNLWVDGIVLLAALVFGLFSVLSKHIDIPPLSLTTIFFLASTIISFASMLLFSSISLPTQSTIIPILLNGVLVNGISYIFWIKALKFGNASFVAPFVFFTPVLSTLILIVFFKEAFHMIYLIGMLMVIMGGLVNRK
ncbi:DMT family transporter [Puteibacter caeruleilacunae]|nr:DMT family transporter [Puteibacter caeruleilacunae]